MSLEKRRGTASKTMRHTARAEKLPVVMTLEGHGPAKDNLFNHVFISYFPDGKQMFSGSRDETSRRWNLETGKEIEEVRDVCGRNIWAVAVSRDGRWVVTSMGEASGDPPWDIKACDVETGVVKTFKGHSPGIICMDISVDSKLLASGAADGFQVWSLDTGNFLAGPSEFKTPTDHYVAAVRFSQDSTKLAVSSGNGIEVWDIQARKILDVTKFGPPPIPTRGVPLFWTTKDRTIVAAITYHDEDEYHPTNMINELDALTLQSVGAPFEGHIDNISGLALSFDCELLAVSASWHDGIKLWAFESRQLLASFGVHRVCDITFSPNSRQLAYSEFGRPTEFGEFGRPTKFSRPKMYICDIPSNILARIWPEQEAVKVCICPHTFTSLVLMSSYGQLNVNIRSSLVSSILMRLLLCVVT
ncbi:YVTN repeat-like/Quino protein amine dehydrogenase [Rhizopogon salebrosus TDB-379]|nr:YVTN repeat-like/Quino protein amine dehydrogenase [Rhizopogon salebrosus TDB-379]